MQMNLPFEDAVMLWNDVVEMAHDCGDPSILPWLERLTPVSLENSVMTVATRQNWTVKKIMGEYRPIIEKLLEEITLEPIALQVVVASATGTGAPAAVVPASSIPAAQPSPAAQAAHIAQAAQSVQAAQQIIQAQAGALQAGSQHVGMPQTDAPQADIVLAPEPQAVPLVPSVSSVSAAPATPATSATPVAPATQTIAVQPAPSPAHMPTHAAAGENPAPEAARLSPAAMAGAAVAAGRSGLFAQKAPGDAILSPAAQAAQAAPYGQAAQPGQMTSYAPAALATPDATAGYIDRANPLGYGSYGDYADYADHADYADRSDRGDYGDRMDRADYIDPLGQPTPTGQSTNPEFKPLAEPEIVAQDAVVPILEDGAIPKAAASTGYSDFSFDTYIVGESNNVAYRMALAVAEQPGSMANPNPLFIWGPSGNGKTHLLLSIANYLHAHQPGMNVQYVPANAFVDQYIDDIRNKRLRGKEVLKAYRAVDVLLVDDVQFFEAKQESVSTFFDIFNQLILDGKQIVLAADTPPDYLALDERMRTRFNSGTVIDIKAPTYEMKRSILVSYYERCRSRMNWCSVEIPPKSFDVLAQQAPNNPRNMQGLITSILIKASEDPSVVTPEGIKEAIKDQFKSTEVVSVSSIIRAISEAYDVTADEIKGKSRTKNISEARQVVMWMARQLTDESYENIGAELGGRDHSTVYYGISTIEKRSIEDKSYLYKLERLKKEITG